METRELQSRSLRAALAGDGAESQRICGLLEELVSPSRCPACASENIAPAADQKEWGCFDCDERWIPDELFFEALQDTPGPVPVQGADCLAKESA